MEDRYDEEKMNEILFSDSQKTRNSVDKKLYQR